MSMRKCCGSDEHKDHDPTCSKAFDQVVAVGFSGGRTSAFMRELISKLDKYKRSKVFTLFCNTGKENEQTVFESQEMDLEWSCICKSS